MQFTNDQTSIEPPLDGDSISHGFANKRRRAFIACSSCRRRKIKCDSEKPNCSNCVKSGLPCVYSAERKKRAKVAQGSPAEVDKNLLRRLDRVESLLTLILENQGVNVKGREESFGSNYSSSSESESELDGDVDSDPEGASMERETASSGGTGSADLFNLNERRAPVALKLGDMEPLIAYTYGFTPTLLSPRSMRWLCESIGNHTLGVQAEAILSRIWKQKTGDMIDYGKKLQPTTELKPSVIIFSVNSFKSFDSHVAKALVDCRDVELVNKLCCPSGDFSKIERYSPYSLLYPSLVLFATQYDFVDSAPFPEEVIKEQNKAAFHACLCRISYLSWVPTTFLLLRLLILSLYAVSRHVMFPQMRSIVSLAVSMAQNLGLHRPEGSRKLKPEERNRREVVWSLLCDLDTKISAALSMMPLRLNYEFASLKCSHKFPKGTDLEQLGPSLDLDRIYLKLHRKLFSRKAQKTSVRTMITIIAQLDQKLLNWRKDLPQSYLDTIELVNAKEQLESGGTKSDDAAREIEDIVQRESRERGFMNMRTARWVQVSTMICYYNIMILLHSLPAFSPSCLEDIDEVDIPPRLLNSLSIISDSARSILKLLFNMKHLQSDECLAFSATNAFSALFLKQIRDPKHTTNAEDLIHIYRCITKFRTITDTMDSGDAQAIMNVWLIFANALTQLNREYPSAAGNVLVQETSAFQRSTANTFGQVGPGAASIMSQPILPQQQRQFHMHQPDHSHPEFRHEQQQQQQQGPDELEQQPQPSQYSETRIGGNMTPQSVFGEQVAAHSVPNKPLLPNGQQFFPETHSTPSHTGASATKTSHYPSGINMITPGSAADGSAINHPPAPAPALAPVQNPRTSEPMGSSFPGQNALWDTFAGMAGVDINLEEGDILQGMESYGTPDYEQPPNNCTIS